MVVNIRPNLEKLGLGARQALQSETFMVLPRDPMRSKCRHVGNSI
jgi:hypothetical protein